MLVDIHHVVGKCVWIVLANSPVDLTDAEADLSKDRAIQSVLCAEFCRITALLHFQIALDEGRQVALRRERALRQLRRYRGRKVFLLLEDRVRGRNWEQLRRVSNDELVQDVSSNRVHARIAEKTLSLVCDVARTVDCANSRENAERVNQIVSTWFL